MLYDEVVRTPLYAVSPVTSIDDIRTHLVQNVEFSYQVWKRSYGRNRLALWERFVEDFLTATRAGGTISSSRYPEFRYRP